MVSQFIDVEKSMVSPFLTLDVDRSSYGVDLMLLYETMITTTENISGMLHCIHGGAEFGTSPGFVAINYQ